MRATGIIRRVDELGRIVIPKEIRRSMRIKEGDPMELYTGKEGIILTKYSPIGSVASCADTYCKGANRSTRLTTMVVDRDTVLSANGSGQGKYVGQIISGELERLMFTRQSTTLHTGNNIPLTVDDATVYFEQIIIPIIVDGEVVGALVGIASAGTDGIDITCQKVLEAIAITIGIECEG